MTTSPLHEALVRGLALHQAGQLADAEAIYHQVLAADPDHAPALHLLGALAIQVGQPQAAIELLSRAVAIDPSAVAYHCNLGVAYQAAGQLEAALQCYDRALAIEPDQVDVLTNRGVLLQALGRPDAALATFKHLLRVRPDHPETLNDVGVLLKAAGRLDEAEARLRRAIELRPGYAGALNNLATVLLARGLREDAARSSELAVSLDPTDVRHLDTLGAIWRSQGRLEDAIVCHEQALMLQPDSLMTLLNLGGVLEAAGRPSEAAGAYRRVLELEPASATAYSGLIAVLDLMPAAQADARAERHRFNAQFGQGWRQQPAVYQNVPDPERRVRVGYVSADFRQHSAATIVMPILRAHNRAQIDVACYSGVTAPDAVTAEARALADVWRDVAGLSDDALAAQIRADAIDILVDLSGHSAGNRLPVFGRKPAPVQVTAWGYAIGTGLDAIDAFLADPIVVSPEMRSHLVEEVIDLPAVACFDLPPDLPTVGPLPARARGWITFGSFHRLPRLTPEALDLWGRVVAAVPQSRVLLKSAGVDEPAARRRIEEAFAARGIAADRLTILGLTSRQQHLLAYQQVDMHLDTIPQTGGVTTLEALTMGVPTVTLLGETVAGRISASFLTVLGLEHLIARTPDEYVDVAAHLAASLDRLAYERATLRQRLLASPIGDTRAYTRAVEDVYRSLWRRWCAR
jgi:protein O-GlcNAc transferase